MISWIQGDLINLWQTNNKFFILINCQGLGYEIQILESVYNNLKSKRISDENIILWLKHIKKEDSDSLFGFISKDQKDFFIEILNIKGVGSQIGMSLLNKFSMNEIINAINTKDKKLISSVQGIGQKMTERLILELKSNLKTKINPREDSQKPKSNFINVEKFSILEDIEITLQSLNYPKKEIIKLIPILTKEIGDSKNQINVKNKITFENLLKQAMNYLDNNNSRLGQ